MPFIHVTKDVITSDGKKLPGPKIDCLAWDNTDLYLDHAKYDMATWKKWLDSSVLSGNDVPSCLIRWGDNGSRLRAGFESRMALTANSLIEVNSKGDIVVMDRVTGAQLFQVSSAGEPYLQASGRGSEREELSWQTAMAMWCASDATNTEMTFSRSASMNRYPPTACAMALNATAARLLLICLLLSQGVCLAQIQKINLPRQRPTPRSAPAQAARSGSDFSAGNGMEMIWVAPLKGWVGKYMVTQDEYQKVMETNPSYFKGPRHPVEQVTWDEAVEYCRKLTERDHAAGILPGRYQYNLPLDAQYDIFVGDAAQDDATAMLNQRQPNYTADVGSQKANQYGLYETRGLFWQWCLDDFKKSMQCEEVRKIVSPVLGPPGKVLRGGTFPHYPEFVIPSSCHCSGKPDFHYWMYGLRAVVSGESAPSLSNSPGKKGK